MKNNPDINSGLTEKVTESNFEGVIQRRPLVMRLLKKKTLVRRMKSHPFNLNNATSEEKVLVRHEIQKENVNPQPNNLTCLLTSEEAQSVPFLPKEKVDPHSVIQGNYKTHESRSSPLCKPLSRVPQLFSGPMNQVPISAQQYRQPQTTSQEFIWNILEMEFRNNMYPNTKRLKRLSQFLGIPDELLRIWFDRRRLQDRLSMWPPAYQYLQLTSPFVSLSLGQFPLANIMTNSIQPTLNPYPYPIPIPHSQTKEQEHLLGQ